MTSQPNFLYKAGAIQPAAPLPQSITILIFLLELILMFSTTSDM